MSKPRGINTARKLRQTRKDNKWSDAHFKKRALGNFYKSSPTGGASQAKGIVLEKVGVEAKQPNSAVSISCRQLLSAPRMRRQIRPLKCIKAECSATKSCNRSASAVTRAEWLLCHAREHDNCFACECCLFVCSCCTRLWRALGQAGFILLARTDTIKVCGQVQQAFARFIGMRFTLTIVYASTADSRVL